MPARLTPEEREQRRKERARRSFSDAAYKNRYDPNAEGYGSADQWKSTINERFGLSQPPHVELDADLALLGFTSPPTSGKEITQRYREMAKTTHPDVSTGSKEAFTALGAAYDRLKTRFRT